MHSDNYQLMAFTRRRKRKKKHEWPDWITRALQTLKPPENLTVSQWADKYRVLDSKTSSEPGQWKTSKTPYLKGIMDAINDPDIEETSFCKSTQIGGTEALNNIVGYVIDQDPSPTMIVYPTDTLAEFTSKNRLNPMIDLCPQMKSKHQENASKLLEIQFDGMYLVLSGANSESSLASKPVRFLLMDEIDKYPLFTGKEAEPRSLARERTRTYPYNKKIFQTSTPTRKSGPIWQEWETADDRRQYFVPCPHCGHYQHFRFKQIKFDKSSPEAAQDSAYYECEECKGTITDSHKPRMLRDGEWRSIRKKGSRRTAFHINAIYSPWLRFGDIAYEFLKSKDYPEKLMNFINSWLAEPWENTEVKMNSDKVLERQSGFEEGVVPERTMLITGGVDVQKDHFYYTIRAWAPRLTSWNITHGTVDTWAEIEDIMNTTFRDSQGNEYIVNLCAIDSGDRTDEVYEFCAMNQEWAVPVKGSSKPLTTRYTVSTIDKVDSKAHGLRLYIVDGAQYKDMIAGRILRPNGPGSWMVYQDCDREYADQICSEEKLIEKNKKGVDVEVWKPKASHAANHYLDCEVYDALAADLLRVRHLSSSEDDMQVDNNTTNRTNESEQNSFIKTSSSWIKDKGGWIR